MKCVVKEMWKNFYMNTFSITSKQTSEKQSVENFVFWTKSISQISACKEFLWLSYRLLKDTI